MKRHTLQLALVVQIVALAARPVAALPPPPTAPFTLWNFLGIPQGFQKIRDATFNRTGDRPGLERLPPLKAIADPENLKSANPAIKAAAAIKSEEDMAPQKIKALKYLSRIGCSSGCYPEAKEALMAALDDCTEEVRYQAVLAIQDAITQHCTAADDRQEGGCACDCDTACCCSEDMVLKLSQRAYERDDEGCFLEPSERVREAAKKVACACCPGRGPTGPPEPTGPPPERAPEGVPEPAPQPPPESPSVYRSRPAHAPGGLVWSGPPVGVAPRGTSARRHARRRFGRREFRQRG